MRTVTIFQRELAATFSNPIAVIFIVAFLILSSALTFYLGGFFARGQADLQAFFRFHPWLHLFLMPALGMRLWAEERRTGTLELLMTLPLTPANLVWGKFLAAWMIAGFALALTFGMPLTIGYLGQPDWGPVFSGYLGSWLMAGSFLAVTATISALTRNQIVAFIIAATICFAFLAADTNILTGFFREIGIESFRGFESLSILSHFDALVDGNMTVHSLIFFASMIGTALFINIRIVEGLDGR